MEPDNPTFSSPSTSASMSSDTGRVIFDRYELGRLLGRGGSAKVYLARDIQSNKSVAIKVFSKSAKYPSSTGSAIREISLMRLLRHKHVLRLKEVLASRSKIYLVLELAKGGELFSKIESHGRFSEEKARNYFKQLISAVRYCHSRGVFHRDLKPENLLLDDNGDLKVADFGLGVLSGRTRSDELFHTVCGTPAYVAPEILSKKGYNASKVDVWSCGVILFVLTAGYLPFNHPNLMTMYKRIYRGEFRFPKWISHDLRVLISGMLDPNSETRITVDGVIKSRWFLNGTDENKWTAEMRSSENMFRSEKKVDEERVLNAFDIIGFSTGCDLSRIFDPAEPVQERFFVAEPAESVLSRVEDSVRKDGIRVKRRGEKGRSEIWMEGPNGNFVGSVDVCFVREGLSMVEVVKGECRFWKEKLAPALNRPV
ncbi:hypothetical protein LUZ60_013119 [Juncus effusus]|nr:hypothetical protein LUZ60_013119 [Juncus effusus]